MDSTVTGILLPLPSFHPIGALGTKDCQNTPEACVVHLWCIGVTSGGFGAKSTVFEVKSEAIGRSLNLPHLSSLLCEKEGAMPVLWEYVRDK